MQNNKINLVLKGVLMGIAEAIPGVSGGTIAFVTGIYHELIETIKAINISNIRLIFSNPKEFWNTINGKFLVTLFAGMLVGVVLGVFVISHLLETQPELLWALFFGLVLASALYLGRDVKWNMKAILAAIVGFALAFSVTLISPSTGTDNLLFIFLAGSIAISAMMLPGISGSFLLLLFGLYQTIIFSLKDFLSGHLFGSHTLILLVFGLGVLTGLFTFSRLLSYLFKNYEQLTMALLIGVLLGSLNKLWPWKVIQTAYNKETQSIENLNDIRLPDLESYKVLIEQNVMPNAYQNFGDAKLLWVILLFIAGMGLVGLIAMIDRKKG